MPSLEARLSRLERSARAWRAIALCALLAVPLLGLDNGVPDEIRTRKLVVVDEAGQEIAALGMLTFPKDKLNYPALIVHAADSSVRAVLAAHRDAAKLVLDYGNQRGAVVAASIPCIGMHTFDETEDTSVGYSLGAAGSLVWGKYRGGEIRTWLRADDGAGRPEF